MKLGELAERLSCEIEGDGEIEITGVATLENARSGEISFLTNRKYYQEARKTQASAIIVGYDCTDLELPVLKHPNPYLIFAKAIEIFHPLPPRQATIHPTAWISEKARVGKNVAVGAFTYIGESVTLEDGVTIHARCSIHEGAIIGENSVIHSGCVIREGVEIGKRCIIQNNAVIGADGFGYAKQDDGSWYKIYQAGTVVIEDDVEIGAGSTVDRGTLGETRIGKGTKIDNLVHVGHGSTVGRDSLLCAQAGLAGSTVVGNQVILAGQVGVAGHLTIGDGVIATAQTGIPNSVEPGRHISGSPAVDHKTWLKSSAVVARLPEIHKLLKELEKRVKSLEETLHAKPDATGKSV